MTKTPEIEYHAADCLYRIAFEKGGAMKPVEGCCSHGELLDKYCPECRKEAEEAEKAEGLRSAIKEYTKNSWPFSPIELEKIDKAPEFKVVLTYHHEDLYPAVAFRIGDQWFAETEGPEDTTDGREGRKYVALYRKPTHFCYLPKVVFKQ
jgi:hypothetical protein